MQLKEQDYKVYSLSALSRATGLGRKTLESWVNQGILIPSGKCEVRKFYTMKEFQEACNISLQVSEKSEKIVNKKPKKPYKYNINLLIRKCYL